MSDASEIIEDDWEISTNRFVAFIDIMGFKNMVATLPHDKIYTMMKKIHSQRKSAEDMDWGKKQKLVRTTTYSDSIMLYSKDEGIESLRHLINSVSRLTHYLFIEGIPHKGGIAHGLMTLDTKNSIFFGQPLIDAYLLQEELTFYGIILHGTCQEQIETRFKQKMTFTKNYLCPLKMGNALHLTVYPIFTAVKKFEADKKKMLTAINQLRFITSGNLRKYIDNTEAYLNSIETVA